MAKGRILAIDYGLRRSGLAWSDPLRIIATGLETVDTERLTERLKQLTAQEPITEMVVGFPTRLDGTDTDVTEAVRVFVASLKEMFPAILIHTLDERFTSRMAARAIAQSGARKKQRQDKRLLDQVSATLLLQDFMQSLG